MNVKEDDDDEMDVRVQLRNHQGEDEKRLLFSSHPIIKAHVMH